MLQKLLHKLAPRVVKSFTCQFPFPTTSESLPRSLTVHIPHASRVQDMIFICNVCVGILSGVKAGECFVANTWGADFVDVMRPAQEDIVVSGKIGLCGFESTNLDFILRQNKIDNVVLGGLLTNCCVESVRHHS